MGSKMAVSDDFEQLADLVHTNKQQQRSSSLSLSLKDRIVTYLNKPDVNEQREICRRLGCDCKFPPGGSSCGCECD